jgi:hypothetical protein
VANEQVLDLGKQVAAQIFEVRSLWERADEVYREVRTLLTHDPDLKPSPPIVEWVPTSLN